MKLHQNERTDLSKDDNWETPDHLYKEICYYTGLRPTIDVCSNEDMSKCNWFISEETNALIGDWDWDYDWYNKQIWCNPPQSKCKDFVLKAGEEWWKYGMDIIMIVPANVGSSHYFQESVKLAKEKTGLIEYDFIPGRIRFLKDGEPAPFKSRNAYIYIWFKSFEVDDISTSSDTDHNKTSA